MYIKSRNLGLLLLLLLLLNLSVRLDLIRNSLVACSLLNLIGLMTTAIKTYDKTLKLLQLQQAAMQVLYSITVAAPISILF